MWMHLECRPDEPVGHGTASPRFQEGNHAACVADLFRVGGARRGERRRSRHWCWRVRRLDRLHPRAQKRWALVALERLQSAETATSVRVRDGERLLTDRPFIETKEYLLGSYLIEAPNLDTALDWAARMPISRFGAVEVRPVLPTPTLAEITAK